MNKKFKELTIVILIILLIVGLGLLCLNQFFGWLYKARLITNPCDYCDAVKNLNINNFNSSINNITFIN